MELLTAHCLLVNLIRRPRVPPPGVQATHGSSHRSRKPAAARLAGFNSLAFRSPPFSHNGHEAPSLTGLPAFLAEQLGDRLARGDRTCPHLGIERHTQRMIEGRAEDLRWDWIVLHVCAGLVGRAVDAPADAGARQHRGEAGRPVASPGYSVI